MRADGSGASSQAKSIDWGSTRQELVFGEYRFSPARGKDGLVKFWTLDWPTDNELSAHVKRSCHFTHQNPCQSLSKSRLLTSRHVASCHVMPRVKKLKTISHTGYEKAKREDIHSTSTVVGKTSPFFARCWNFAPPLTKVPGRD